MLQTLDVHAFAKVNLGLRLLGRREDGYHEIRTVYQTLALHDRLKISIVPGARPDLQVVCDDPQLPSGQGNLVWRACESWRRARRFRGRIRVELIKRIPAGSGLGGASTDAAATFLGLERLTGDRLEFERRMEIAAKLGSDVPLFLWGGRVLGCGRGEEVYPLPDFPSRAGLIVFPRFAVSTAWAYAEAARRFGLTKSAKVFSMDNFGAWPRLPLKDWGPAENDFERVVFARWPELGRVKRQLLRAGAETASLTGSGSALFALFTSARQRVRALQYVPSVWQVIGTRTLPRTEYERRLFAGGA